MNHKLSRYCYDFHVRLLACDLCTGPILLILVLFLSYINTPGIADDTVVLYPHVHFISWWEQTRLAIRLVTQCFG